MELKRGIQYKGWNISIETTEDGFNIFGTHEDTQPMGLIKVLAGDLKGSILRMKEKIDKRNIALKENVKELNAVILEMPEDEVPF